tara:strand:- start:616 stop:798 length:183 start_codon:yes stop_codon:yes gene_type:complete
MDYNILAEAGDNLQAYISLGFVAFSTITALQALSSARKAKKNLENNDQDKIIEQGGLEII